MCHECDAQVAECGTYLDGLIQLEREAMQREPDMTTPQHTMRFTTIILQSLDECGPSSIPDFAMAFSIMVQRLIALEAIS